MKREDLKEYLESLEQSTVLLEPDYFDSAIVGITEDGRLLYSYDRLIESVMKGLHIEEQDAIDMIKVNTIPSLTYMGDHAPIVMYELPFDNE